MCKRRHSAKDTQMTDGLTAVWRLPGKTRVIALGAVQRNNRILVSAVTQDDGSVKGWRPLGGGVEFGERAIAALIREFSEEIQATLTDIRQIGVLENIFTHADQTGHEIVFVFTAALSDEGLAAPDKFILQDGPFRNRAAWILIEDFRSGREVLFPNGLLALL